MNGEELARCARRLGILTEYRDMRGRLRRPSARALQAVLRELEEPGREPALQPVSVAWEGRATPIRLGRGASPWRKGPRGASFGTDRRVRCTLELEEGERRSWTARPRAGRLALPARLPLGYHRLRVEGSAGVGETVLISAPSRCHRPLAAKDDRTWGLFLPLYALHTQRSWGAGDLTDLRRFLRWSARRGARLFGTLPLNALFLEGREQPSPYAPVSRLFWSEFWVDPTRLPEWRMSPQARRLAGSARFRRELNALRRLPHVDYLRVARGRREILELLAEQFFRRGSPARRRGFERYLAEHPDAEPFARFRAACERWGRPWSRWPEPAREGRLRRDEVGEERVRYHLYAQWAAEDEVRALSADGRRAGVGLYLDLPLGVHPDGYDVWSRRGLFVRTMSAGAPPDPLFWGGQDWGFPPLHPRRIREEGYLYVRAVLAKAMEHADWIRVDHAMALHRLFWVPRGMPAREGVYVRYPAEELYAVLCLESHRHRCGVVGENLGTVPPEVNRGIARRGLSAMFVLQYELNPRKPLKLPPVPRESAASLNTHDMPPFAAYWRGLSARAKGNLARALAAVLSRPRSGREIEISRLARNDRWSGSSALCAALRWLAASSARLLVVGVEDLWGERRPQNVPGTGPERRNWRRKARYALEQFTRLRAVREIMGDVDACRRETQKPGSHFLRNSDERSRKK